MGSGASSKAREEAKMADADDGDRLLDDPSGRVEMTSAAEKTSGARSARKTLADINREKGQTLLKQVKESSKDMARLVAVLKSLPREKLDSATLKPDLFHKDGGKAPVSHGGYLETPSSTGKWKKVYYELIGGYLVAYKSEEVSNDRPKSITLFTYVLDSVNVITGGAFKDLNPEFVGESEKDAPVSILLYTRSKAMVLRSSSPKEKNEWMAAFNEAMAELYSKEEIEEKRVAEMDLRPMMLKADSLQFEKRNLILTNLSAAGFIGKVKGPRTVKQGNLKFQRSQFEEQKFFASLMPDTEVGVERWKKYYCALREDATLVYAVDSKGIKSDPKGVISLTHLSVQLHMEEIEKTGKLVFSLVTPLRSFVLSAPHQVALEEWLAAFVKVVENTGAVGRKISMLKTLGELHKMHVTDIDLIGLLENDEGYSLYSSFMEAKMASDDHAPDQDTINLWACWEEIKEYKDMEDEVDATNENDLKDKITNIAMTYLADTAPKKLPSDVDEVKKDVIDQVEKNEPVEVNLLHTKIAKCLHKKNFNELRQTGEFKELMESITKASETEGQLDLEADRMLIWTPQKGEDGKKFDIDHHGSKRYKWVGDEIYCTLKDGKDNIIGRDKKCQVVLDTDRKVSRQHAKIDCQKDGRVVFSDLGSSRGSKVNGKTVSGRVNLSVGDKLKIGKTELLFTITDDTKQPIL